MQANAMFYKVVSQKSGAYNILCGFQRKLTFATAERVTSEVAGLDAERVERIVAQHAKDLNAAETIDLTDGKIYVKLEKQKEENTFASLGVGRYL